MLHICETFVIFSSPSVSDSSPQVEIAAVLVFAWAKLISYSQVLGFAGVVGAWRHLCWFLDPRKVLWWLAPNMGSEI